MIEQFLRGGFLHLDVGEEFLAGIFQAGAKEVNHIIDNQESVVVTLAVIDGDRWILLVMALNVELQLSHILRQLQHSRCFRLLPDGTPRRGAGGDGCAGLNGQR